MCDRLRSEAIVACHLKINESRVRTIVKTTREIGEPITTATPSETKTLHLCKMPFHLASKMQLLCGCRIAIGKGCLYILMIQEKGKSLYDKAKGR